MSSLPARLRRRSLVGAGSLLVAGAVQALPAFELPEVDIHGFVSQGYLISTENEYLDPTSTDGTFEVNEFGLNLSSEITDRIRVGVQLFSRDLGLWSNNELEVDWAYGDVFFRDEISLRAGRIKTPRGLWQEVQDFGFLRPWAMLPTSVYDPSSRTFGSAIDGAQLYGTFDLGAGGSLSYQVTGGDGDLDGNEDVERLFTVQSDVDAVDSIDLDLILNVHLEYSPPVDGLRVVGTFVHVDDMAAQLRGTTTSPMLPGIAINYQSEFAFDRYDVLTLGAEYLWQDWGFYLEYYRVWTDYTVTVSDMVVDENDYQQDGFYLGASYRLDEHWSFGAYHSSFWVDVDDRDGDDRAVDHTAWRHDTTLTIRYDINDNWLVKAEGHLVNGTAGLEYYGNDELEEDWQYVLLKTTFNF